MPGRRDSRPAAAPEARWAEVRRRIERIPSDPVSRSHPRVLVRRAKRGADFVGHISMRRARFFARLNPYPRPFSHVTLRTQDNVRIAAWVGPHRPTAPSRWGIVQVPGMFSTKDDTVHKRRAIWMWRHWRMPVASIDLRGFGESHGISTAGWKEAHDVLAAAEHLRREYHVQHVAVVAESLGGAAALNALAIDAQQGSDLLGAGLTWSAFMDARDAVEYISSQPPADHPFASQWAGFRRMLRWKSMGGYDRFSDFMEDAARVNGLPDVASLYELANPKVRVRHIKAPTLLVHAADDPVVPVRHARRIERYAGGMDHVQAMVVPWGGHTGFEVRDPPWFWEVTRQWLGAAMEQVLPMPGGLPERPVEWDAPP